MTETEGTLSFACADINYQNQGSRSGPTKVGKKFMLDGLFWELKASSLTWAFLGLGIGKLEFFIKKFVFSAVIF